MFKFKDKSDKDMKVVLEEEYVFLKKAKRVVSEKTNKDYYEHGYSKVDFDMVLQVYNEDLDSIYSWLNGKGILEYKNRVTNAYIYNEISPERMATLKKLVVSVTRFPFWYKKDDTYVKVTSGKIINEGNVEVRPIIKLIKKTANKVNLRINNILFAYSFPNNENEVIFDCDSFNAKYNELYRNEYLEIGFDYPTLYPGENKIEILNDVDVYIKHKDCWL